MMRPYDRSGGDQVNSMCSEDLFDTEMFFGALPGPASVYGTSQAQMNLNDDAQ